VGGVVEGREKCDFGMGSWNIEVMEVLKLSWGGLFGGRGWLTIEGWDLRGLIFGLGGDWSLGRWAGKKRKRM